MRAVHHGDDALTRHAGPVPSLPAQPSAAGDLAPLRTPGRNDPQRRGRGRAGCLHRSVCAGGFCSGGSPDHCIVPTRGTHPRGQPLRARLCTCRPALELPPASAAPRRFRADARRSRQVPAPGGWNTSRTTLIRYPQTRAPQHHRCAAPYGDGLVAFTERAKHVMLQPGGARDSGERSAFAESGPGRSRLPPAHPRPGTGVRKGVRMFRTTCRCDSSRRRRHCATRCGAVTGVAAITASPR